MATARKPRAGEAVDLQIRVRDRDNARPAFEIVHEALMHLVIVRRDLGGIRARAPNAGDDGRFQRATRSRQVETTICSRMSHPKARARRS